MKLAAQVQLVFDALVECGEPGAPLSDITEKARDLGQQRGSEYAAHTFHNSVRRCIYEHLGDDHEGVFVRDGRGVYRLSVRILFNVVFQADSWKLTRLLPSESIDCVITDPPWTYQDKHRATGTTTRLMQRGWFPTKDLDAGIIREIARVMKKGSHLYLFFPPITADTIALFQSVTACMAEAGLAFEKALVWDKKRIGMGYRYRVRHEIVLFAAKGKKRPLRDRSVPDVLEYETVPPSRKVHDAQKPDDLVRVFVEQATAEGELVADFFAGSGVVGASAQATGRAYLLADVDPKWVDHMERELQPAASYELA